MCFIPKRCHVDFGAHHFCWYSLARSKNIAIINSLSPLLRISGSRNLHTRPRRPPWGNTNAHSNQAAEYHKYSPHVQPSIHPLARISRLLRALEDVSAEDGEETAKPEIPGSTEDLAKDTSLPLSPLMDPELIKRRSKKREPKISREPLTDFEKAIALNPFACMLASPARMDSISEARVPSAFLRPFTIRKDPGSAVVWQLPKDLEPKPLDETHAQAGALGEPNLEQLDAYSEEAKAASAEWRRLATCWAASTHAAMHYMSRGSRSKRQLLRRRSLVTTTPRWRTLPLETQAKITVRDNHAAFIFELLRRRTVRELASLPDKQDARWPAPVVPWPAPMGDPVDAAYSVERVLDSTSTDGDEYCLQNCVLLWLGDNSSESARQKERLFGSLETPIHDPIIRISHGRTVPVLDAQTLLGSTCLSWAKRKNPIFQYPAILVKQTASSRHALMWLWQLRLYGQGGGAEM